MKLNLLFKWLVFIMFLPNLFWFFFPLLSALVRLLSLFLFLSTPKTLTKLTSYSPLEISESKHLVWNTKPVVLLVYYNLLKQVWINLITVLFFSCSAN